MLLNPYFLLRKLGNRRFGCQALADLGCGKAPGSHCVQLVLTRCFPHAVPCSYLWIWSFYLSCWNHPTPRGWWRGERWCRRFAAGLRSWSWASIAPEPNRLWINVSHHEGTWTSLGKNYPNFCQGFVSYRVDWTEKLKTTSPTLVFQLQPSADMPFLSWFCGVFFTLSKPAVIVSLHTQRWFIKISVAPWLIQYL